MTFEEFTASLQYNNPPAPLSPLLVALWYDAKGNWNKAHQITDGYGTAEGDWVHAYLHRAEGDT